MGGCAEGEGALEAVAESPLVPTRRSSRLLVDPPLLLVTQSSLKLNSTGPPCL